jgi:hypothetical protein
LSSRYCSTRRVRGSTAALVARMPAGFRRRASEPGGKRYISAKRYVPLAANITRRRLARRRRCSTNDANDAWSQSRVAAGNGTRKGHRHSCHFFCSICSSRNNRCSAVKLLPDIVVCIAKFPFQLADVNRPSPSYSSGSLPHTFLRAGVTSAASRR